MEDNEMSYAMINLQDYATFSTIDEMDDNVKHFNRQLNKAHYETLNLLKQYSLKVIGVSHLKIQTIADRLNKSTRTIKRHIKYLKDNGFITVVSTNRKQGQGANAYIINTNDYRKKYVKNNNVTPKVSPLNDNKKDGKTQASKAFAYVKARKETIEYLKLFSNNKSTQDVNNNTVENVRTCPVNVPYQLYLMAKPFITDSEINKIYNAALHKIRFFKSDIVNEYKDEIIERSFKSLFNAMRDYKGGRRSDKVYNKRNYVLSAIWHTAIKLETFQDIDDYITPIKHDGVESLYS